MFASCNRESKTEKKLTKMLEQIASDMEAKAKQQADKANSLEKKNFRPQETRKKASSVSKPIAPTNLNLKISKSPAQKVASLKNPILIPKPVPKVLKTRPYQMDISKIEEQALAKIRRMPKRHRDSAKEMLEQLKRLEVKLYLHKDGKAERITKKPSLAQANLITTEIAIGSWKKWKRTIVLTFDKVRRKRKLRYYCWSRRNKLFCQRYRRGKIISYTKEAIQPTR